MRVQKEFIEAISKKVVRSLIDKDLIIWEDTTDKLETIISGIITEDLMVEDLLNEEVKTLLESKTEEYERSMMDYGRVFQMVKSKLVRERGLDNKADTDARRIMSTYKNPPREGSPEWDIMYQKHFDEFTNKQGV